MVEAIGSGKYPFVMCNFAPPDMVGHTGVYDAAVIACAATGQAGGGGGGGDLGAYRIHAVVTYFADVAIGEIQESCEKNGYVMLVTADHGNAERMIDESGKPVTKHTTFRGTRNACNYWLFLHPMICTAGLNNYCSSLACLSRKCRECN